MPPLFSDSRFPYTLHYPNGNKFIVTFTKFKNRRLRLIADIVLFIGNSIEFDNSNDSCENLINHLRNPDTSYIQFKKFIYNFIVENRN